MSKNWIWIWLLLLGFACGGNDKSDALSGDDDDSLPVDPCAECTDDQLCEEDICVDNPVGWVNPEKLVGLTFAFMCIFDGVTTEPPRMAVNPGPYGDPCVDVLPVAFTFWGVEANGERLSVTGAILTADARYDPDQSVTLQSPTADFSANPTMELRAENVLEMEVEGVILRLLDWRITGRVQKDRSGITEGVFVGLGDPSPLEPILGAPPCDLIPGICDDEGYIPLRIEELTAIRVDTTIPAP